MCDMQDASFEWTKIMQNTCKMNTYVEIKDIFRFNRESVNQILSGKEPLRLPLISEIAVHHIIERFKKLSLVPKIAERIRLCFKK